MKDQTDHDGGPAFPAERMTTIQFYNEDGPIQEHIARYSGVSVLDYFAAHALIHAGGSESTMRHVAGGGERKEQMARLAAWAYDMGEAFVAERAKRILAWSEAQE